MAMGIEVNKGNVAVVALVALFLLTMWLRNLHSGLDEGEDETSSSSLDSGMALRVSTSKEIELRQLFSASVDLAQRAGKLVKKVDEGGNLEEVVKGKTLEGVDEPLTLADSLSHLEMYTGFKSAWPNLHIVSEEHVEREYSTLPPNLNLFSQLKAVKVPMEDITVWIDPLDATKEFTEKLSHFVTVLVCIAYKGTPIGGVIHHPFPDKKTGVTKTYWGFSGIGDIEEVSPADIAPDQEGKLRIIVSRSHAGQVESVAKASFSEEPVIIPAGGSGYKTEQVFLNEADMYLHVTKIKKWDFCSGDALLRASGGKMTDLKGNEFDYHYTTNPENFGGLLAASSEENHAKYLHALEPQAEAIMKSKH